ncbi:MAG: ProQ/FINO family protein [Halomonadaceae bacterium]
MAASLMNMLDDLEARLERTQAELQALREENQQLKRQLAGQEAPEQSVPKAESHDTAFSTETALETHERTQESAGAETAELSEAANAAVTAKEGSPTQPAAETAQAPSPHALLNQWYERYPKAFFKGHTKPLKVGIHQDLAEREEWSNKLIRRALANYVNLPRYIKAVRAGAERVDLDGLPAGKVDKEAALHASEKRGDQQERGDKKGDKKAGVQSKKAPSKSKSLDEKPRQEQPKQAKAQPETEKSQPRKPLSMEDKLLGLQQKFKGR